MRRLLDDAAVDNGEIRAKEPTLIRYEMSDLTWKAVKGNHPTKSLVCPRCHNRVDYYFAYAATSFVGLFGLALSFATSKTYAYKCPVCPNVEEVSDEVAKAIQQRR